MSIDLKDNIRPSNFERRMLCPGSYHAEKDLPHVTSKYAKEGNLLHEKTAANLTDKIDWQNNLSEAQIEAVIKASSYFNDLKLKKDCVVLGEFHEQQYDLSFIYSKLKGTADSVLILKNTETNKNELHIIDYKFGKGVAVNAHENYQLLLYSLGVMNDLRIRALMNGSNPEINLHIVQPYISNSHWKLTLEDVIKYCRVTFYTEVIEKCLKPNTKRIPSNKACKFCKAKSTCKELAATIPKIENNPEILSDAEIAQIYENKPLILAYLNSIEDYITNKLKEGDFSNYILEPKLSRSQWGDNAKEKLVELMGDKAFDLQLISVSNAKKQLNHKDIEDIIIRKEIGTKIVKIGDKSKEIFKNFNND